MPSELIPSDRNMLLAWRGRVDCVYTLMIRPAFSWQERPWWPSVLTYLLQKHRYGEQTGTPRWRPEAIRMVSGKYRCWLKKKRAAIRRISVLLHTNLSHSIKHSWLQSKIFKSTCGRLWIEHNPEDTYLSFTRSCRINRHNFGKSVHNTNMLISLSR